MKGTLLKRTYLFTILLLCMNCTPTFAQIGQRLERVHALKVSYITDNIHLTSEQSEQFWPVYNQFEKELRRLRFDYLKKYRRESALGDRSIEEAQHFIDDNLDYQQEVLTLRKEYKDRFLKILSPQQLADLYIAERDFKKLLLQELQKRRSKR